MKHQIATQKLMPEFTFNKLFSRTYIIKKLAFILIAVAAISASASAAFEQSAATPDANAGDTSKKEKSSHKREHKKGKKEVTGNATPATAK